MRVQTIPKRSMRLRKASLILAGFVSWLFLALIYMSLAGGLATAEFSRPLAALVLLGLHLLVAFGLEKPLNGFVSVKWSYRAAFLVSVSLVPAGMLFSDLQLPLLVWILAALVGAFSGGLMATARREGLWENNHPPSAQVKAEVVRKHGRMLVEAAPTPVGKRIFDILVACLGLILTLPIWSTSLLLLWLEDPGPLLFIKNSVGRNGKNFHQLKMRTMIRDAEVNTGPIMAMQEDGRVLQFGRLLRKTALDELPQLWNILRGDMSFVGPRPQRTILVNGYLDELPEYAYRHAVLPGLSGLAQVVGHYYLTPRQKLRFDRLYVRYASLGFDLKLIGLAFLLVFWLRWKPDWNGRIPRGWLRFGYRQS